MATQCAIAKIRRYRLVNTLSAGSAGYMCYETIDATTPYVQNTLNTFYDDSTNIAMHCIYSTCLTRQNYTLVHTYLVHVHTVKLHISVLKCYKNSSVPDVGFNTAAFLMQLPHRNSISDVPLQFYKKNKFHTLLEIIKKHHTIVFSEYVHRR